MTTTIRMIPVDLIDPHPHNPRRDLGDLTELTASIAAQGIRQNLLLTAWAGRYRAVIGHRRLAAARLAGLTEVPAVVDDDLTAAQQLELMLLENIQRSDLSPVEEAEGYQGLLDLGVKVRQIAKATGRAEKTVTARLRLMKLPEQARQMVHTHQATLEDAAALQTLEDRPDLVAQAVKQLGTAQFSYALRTAQDTRKSDLAKAPLVAWCEQHGIPAMTDSEYRSGKLTKVGDGTTLAELDQLTLPDDLADVRYRPVGWYDGISLHRLLPADVDADQARAAEQQRLDDERAALIAEADALFAHRDEWIRAYCARKRIPAKDQLAILATIGPFVLAGGIHLNSFQVDMWLRPGAKTDYPDLDVRLARVAEWLPDADPAACLLAALHIEAGSPWSDEWRRLDGRLLYGLLVQLGYPMSDAERARITRPEDADDDAEDDAEDGAA